MKDRGLRIERSKLYLSKRIKSREFEKGWWVLKQGFCKIRRRRSDFFWAGFERDGWGDRWSWEDNEEGVDLGRSDRWIAGRGLKIREKWEEEKGGGGLGEERRRNSLSKRWRNGRCFSYLLPVDFGKSTRVLSAVHVALLWAEMLSQGGAQFRWPMVKRSRCRADTSPQVGRGVYNFTCNCLLFFY